MIVPRLLRLITSVIILSVAPAASAFEADAPVNDDFANATVLEGAKGSLSGRTDAATTESGEPDHVGFGELDPSVWFQWTASMDGRLIVDTAGSELEAVVAAYTGDAVQALTKLASDDGYGRTGSRIDFEVKTGEVYFIAIADYWGETGAYTLNYQYSDGSPTIRAYDEAFLWDGHHANWRTILTLGNNGTENLDIEIESTADWLTVGVESGVIAPGEAETFELRIGTPPSFTGALTAQLKLSSNDVHNPTVNIPVTLTDEGLYFPDVHLWKALAPDGSPVLAENFATLENLTLLSGNITDLTGIEQATGLRRLDISHNRVENLAPLASLTDLEVLNASHNFVSDLSTLELFKNLLDLDLRYNVLDLGETSPARASIDALLAEEVEVDYEPQRSPAPANDDFAHAIVLEGNFGQATGSTEFATSELDEPVAELQSVPLQSVWFEWTATSDGYLNVDTFGSRFDTVLSAYTGNGLADLERQASNDDHFELTSWVTFEVEAGSTYSIVIDGYEVDAGDYTLNYFFHDGSPTIRASVPEIRFEATLDGAFESAFELWNEGREALEIIKVESNVEWLVPAYEAGTIEPQADQTIALWIYELPDAAEGPVATITITSNAVNHPTLEIPVRVIEGLHMPDRRLREEVLKNLGMPAGSMIEETDFAGLKFLYLESNNVVELTGLEYATDLTGILIEANHISDLLPLANFEKLDYLVITRNKLTDLTPLLEVESLTSLVVIDNFLDLKEGSAAREQIDSLTAAGVEVNYDPQRPAPPANDDFANAEVLAAKRGSIDAANLSATGELGEPNQEGKDNFLNTMWYAFTSPENGSLFLEITSSAFTMRASVYTGSALSDIAEVDSFMSTWGRQRLTVSAGTTYWIRLDGFEDDVGPFELAYDFRNHAPFIIPLHEALMLDGTQADDFHTEMTLRNDESEVLQYRIASDVDWLVPETASGTIAGDSEVVIRIDVINPPAFTGRIEGILTITSNANNAPTLAIPVTLSKEGLQFPDPNLREAIVKSLKLPKGSALFEQDFEGVSSLDLTGMQLSDLSGIEVAKDLVGLSIARNQIDDLSPLSSLAKLQVLQASENHITDLSPLLGLEHLRTLYVTANRLDLTEGSSAHGQIDALVEAGVSVQFDLQRRAPLSGSESIGDGYYRLEGLGDYYGAYFEQSGWIYHFGLRWWLYLHGDDPEHLWMWSESFGWIWTGAALYPNIYRDDTADWLYYLETGEDPRWFYSRAAGEWQSHNE